VVERPGAALLTIDSPAAVSFREITFGYSSDRPVLHEVSLESSPGQLVALVGATGSGKSTLLSLLPRFYDPWSGGVLINGRDVRDFTLPSLRGNVAVVLQDSLIFRTTVLENIAYGRPDATREEIIAAGEAAGVSLIAARLEDGYDTVVSERGASLSGGEKQCIGIARALLKDAPIVVLDEPTSAMDAHTERLVMDGVERLLEGRTGFIIAHRLSTVMKADLVAVLDDGRMVESGDPVTLLDDPSSRFAGLARAQLIPDGASTHAVAATPDPVNVSGRRRTPSRAYPLRLRRRGRG
jgi:ATP-binding cassette subfamily B protein/subfamily B ATP-binding cassette protein MsbA